jgi:hypothetical protein
MTTPQLGGAAIATKYYAPLVTDRTVLVNEPSPSAEHVNRLLNSTVLPELHALAWLEPFTNSSDSRWDPGWGCRDHAVVLAALLTSGGTDAQVVHGANVFIQGPTTDGQDPVGLGNDLAHGGEHTWVDVYFIPLFVERHSANGCLSSSNPGASRRGWVSHFPAVVCTKSPAQPTA